MGLALLSAGDEGAQENNRKASAGTQVVDLCSWIPWEHLLHMHCLRKSKSLNQSWSQVLNISEDSLCTCLANLPINHRCGRKTKESPLIL